MSSSRRSTGRRLDADGQRPALGRGVGVGADDEAQRVAVHEARPRAGRARPRRPAAGAARAARISCGDRCDVELARLGQDDSAHAAASSGSRESLREPQADAALRRAEGDALDGGQLPRRQAAPVGEADRLALLVGQAPHGGAREPALGGAREAASGGSAMPARSDAGLLLEPLLDPLAERVRRRGRGRGCGRAVSGTGPSGPRRSSWPEPRQTRSKTSCTMSSASAASRRIENAARCTSAACSA